jgi:hypothetical protein
VIPSGAATHRSSRVAVVPRGRVAGGGRGFRVYSATRPPAVTRSSGGSLARPALGGCCSCRFRASSLVAVLSIRCKGTDRGSTTDQRAATHGGALVVIHGVVAAVVGFAAAVARRRAGDARARVLADPAAGTTAQRTLDRFGLALDDLRTRADPRLPPARRGPRAILTNGLKAPRRCRRRPIRRRHSHPPLTPPRYDLNAPCIRPQQRGSGPAHR